MIFYEQETWIGLFWASIPAMISLYLYIWRGDEKRALWLLLLSAFLLRLVMISLDPFIHEWDERYHALVAKNMMTHPFRPMLQVHPVFPYDIADWSNNHVWVHKQPLFLWQMALSMKIFGVSPFAVRLPSAILGTVLVWLVYHIGRNLTKDGRVGYLAALLSTFSYYTLELTSGWRSLEHNDLVFAFYVAAGVWALTKYIQSGFTVKWAMIIGLATGLAILVKWLTALVVFGGWGLYLLQSTQLRGNLWYYRHMALALLAACAVFLPWQVYIHIAFPAETAVAYAHNVKHITSDLGHSGDALSYIRFLSTAYHVYLTPFIIIGFVAAFFYKAADKKLAVSFIAMIAVVYAFFSLVVKTKMPGLVYPVSSLMLVFMATGPGIVANGLVRNRVFMPWIQNGLWTLVFIAAAYLSLKPKEIAAFRSIENHYRNSKIYNANVYRDLPENILRDRIIINCLRHNHIELMFYRDAKANHWFPPGHMLDSLQQAGYSFAAFRNVPGQVLPEYILEDPEVVIMDDQIR